MDNEDEFIGKCAVCGQIGKLTFEHLPPRTANNKRPSKNYKLEDVLNATSHLDHFPNSLKGVKYKMQNRGFGKYSLCFKCNNYFGRYYVPEYSKINNALLKIIIDNKVEYTRSSCMKIDFLDIRPLEFSKQVLSMFCSANGNLIDACPNIRTFLLNHVLNASDINLPNLRIYMYLLQEGSMDGITGQVSALCKDKRIDTFNEIDFFPLGFQLSFDGMPRNAYDMTSFLSYKQNQSVSMKAIIPIVKKPTIMPISLLS